MNRNLYNPNGLDRKINWHGLVATLVLLIAFLSALVFCSWNDAQASASDAKRAEASTKQAEANLAHCLNGGWFNSSVGVIGCGRAM